MRKLGALLVLLMLVCPSLARAQLAVEDVAVLAAVGSAVTALKAILDDTRRSLAALANWPQVIYRLQLIAQLITDLEALVTEIERIDEGWAQLSDSGRVLCSIDEAVSWKGQALQWQQEAFRVARTARRLLGRGIAVMVDLQFILEEIVGPTSGAQSQGTLLTVIASQLAQLHSLTGSMGTATVGKDVIESVTGIHLVCIHSHAFDGWGSYSR